MLTDIQILIVTAAAIIGAIVSATLGWLDSGEAFAWRKYTGSLLRAIVAGIVFAASTYSGVVDVTLGGWMYLFAFLGGAGIDVLGNRVAGAINAQGSTTTPPTTA